ncbi:MAG: AAA family ATPase, partial [Planctomycetes bacterium]|nr:AAA family ATPase [Planctomycetota bacterium]
KTCIAVNLALALQKMGKKVLLVDIDLGLANADILLGLNPPCSLFEVITKKLPLTQAIVQHHSGLDFIPAASGREELTRLSHKDFLHVIRELQLCCSHYDMCILDTAAGISREVTTFLRCSQRICVVLTPDPTSMTDAYALIKVLEQQEPGKIIDIVVNQAQSDEEALLVFQRMQKVCQSYLRRDVHYLGHVPHDRLVVDTVRQRSPYINIPDCRAANAVRGIATRLKGVFHDNVINH